MKKLAFLLLCILPFCVSAKEYKMKFDRALTEVVNSSEADVELIYSPTAAANIVVAYDSPEVEAPLQITVSATGKLFIKTNRKKNYRISTVKVYYNSYIEGITNSGTGDLQAKKINAPINLTIVNSGTGDIEIKEVNVKKLTLKNSGTGDVDFDSGKAVTLNIHNSGTGDVKAKINSAESDISNSGTGDVTGLRSSSKKMKLSNCGTGKIVIKKQKIGGDIQISPNCDRNIRFVK